MGGGGRGGARPDPPSDVRRRSALDLLGGDRSRILGVRGRDLRAGRVATRSVQPNLQRGCGSERNSWVGNWAGRVDFARGEWPGTPGTAAPVILPGSGRLDGWGGPRMGWWRHGSQSRVAFGAWALVLACSSSSSPPPVSGPIVGEWASPTSAVNYFFNADGTAGTFAKGGGCNPWFAYSLSGDTLTLRATSDVGPGGGSVTVAFSNGNDSLCFGYAQSAGLPGTPIYVAGSCDGDSGACVTTLTRVNSNSANECPAGSVQPMGRIAAFVYGGR